MRQTTRSNSGLFPSLKNITIAATSAAILVFTIPGKLVMAKDKHTFTDYAKVIHVEPSFRYITVKVPQRICAPGYNHHSGRHNNKSPNYQHRNRGQHFQNTQHHRNDTSGAVFIGGLIGGVIGHEISKNTSGRNRATDTFTGAVIGSTLAGAAAQSGHYQGQRYTQNTGNRHHRTHDKHQKRHHRPHHQSGHQRCTTTTQSRKERRPNGYNVTYVYHGRKFHTHIQHHPGRRIAVQVRLNTH